jgi:pectate lyase
MELRVTAHHNWYMATESYHPRLRFGIAHSYNNLIDSWTEWGSGAAMDGKLLSEANVFRPLDDFEATITSIGDDPAPGFVRSVNDVANGATIETNGEDQVPDPPYLYMVDPTDTLEAVLRAQTGPQPWP